MKYRASTVEASGSVGWAGFESQEEVSLFCQLLHLHQARLAQRVTIQYRPGGNAVHADATLSTAEHDRATAQLKMVNQWVAELDQEDAAEAAQPDRGRLDLLETRLARLEGNLTRVLTVICEVWEAEEAAEEPSASHSPGKHPRPA